MFEELIQISLEDSQRVLLASIGNGLFEIYMTSYEAKDPNTEEELIANLSIEQYLLRQDEGGSLEYILLDEEVLSKELCYPIDMPISEVVKMVAQEAIIFAEEFCKEVSLRYCTL